MVPQPVWTHIPVSAAEALAADYGVWHAAYDATLVPHVPAVTAVKNAAREHSDDVLKEFKTRYLLYAPVTTADLIAMGFHIAKEPSRIEPPATRPQLTFDTSTPLQVGIYYHDEGSTRRGKPDHVHAAFLRWDFRDTAPPHPNDLKNAITDTDQPAMIKYLETDRGKTICAAGAWQIEREGELGPWSNFEFVIAP
jgi:hypothetical protein